jgi:malate dehydrogenase (oxaloacetate-decarboxylating)
MLDFTIKINSKTGEKYLETPMEGKTLLCIPQLNKGTAFTLEERLDFGLLGKLPSRIETLAEQVERAYAQCLSYQTPLQRNIYLANLHDKNQIVFYKLVSQHLAEFLPVIYTPTVSEAVTSFSRKFRQPRGLYFSYPEREYFSHILQNRSNADIDIICVTDGQSILGIGDQGIGGMEIPIAKLMVYSLCGGLDPNRLLSMTIDVGTNNETLLNDPNYLGWKHPRLEGDEYFNFIDQVVENIRQVLPNAFIHWEDFGAHNARKILERYQSQFCTFNDDIEGTGATALAAIMSASAAQKQSITTQKIIIFGAGTAGMGIANQIAEGMVFAGLSKEDAIKQIWLIDRYGLIGEFSQHIDSSQRVYARSAREIAQWQLADENNISLLDVIRNIQPTILIGASAVTGAFSETVVRTMAQGCEHPIIMPLSNPTMRAEASPRDLIEWTNGKALIATGSPYPPVEYAGRRYVIGQCNNARVFPGIGLGVVLAKPTLLSSNMLMAAALALSECAPVLQDINAPILPGAEDSEIIAKKIAYAVGKQAIHEGLSTITLEELTTLIEETYWKPRYLPYKYKAL